MIKNKIKTLTLGILIILSMTLCGCNLNKYNNIGNFKSDDSMKLYKDKKYDEALKSINTFLEKYPRNKKAISQKAFVLIGSGKNQDGLLLLTDLYESGVEDATILNNTSWAYNNLHLYEMANKYADLCLKSSAGDEEEYVNKGNALHGLKKYDDAIKYYDKALQKNPKYTFALFGKGLCLYEEEQYSDCLVYFKKYVELKGENADVNNYISNAYLKQNDFTGAIDEFKRQIKSNPEDIKVYISLGYIYEKQGEFNKAIDCYNSVINKKVNDAVAYYDKSICLVKLGKKDEACENLKSAIEYDEDYIYDIQDDREFDSLRDYDKFKEIINSK